MKDQNAIRTSLKQLLSNEFSLSDSDFDADVTVSDYVDDLKQLSRKLSEELSADIDAADLQGVTVQSLVELIHSRQRA